MRRIDLIRVLLLGDVPHVDSLETMLTNMDCSIAQISASTNPLLDFHCLVDLHQRETHENALRARLAQVMPLLFAAHRVQVGRRWDSRMSKGGSEE